MDRYGDNSEDEHDNEDDILNALDREEEDDDALNRVKEYRMQQYKDE